MNNQVIMRKAISVFVKVHSGEGEYIDGIFVPGQVSIYEKPMVVASISTDDLEYFDKSNFEENFTMEDRKFYDPIMDLDIKENDIIIYNNVEFEVVKVFDRNDQGFKVYFGKINE